MKKSLLIVAGIVVALAAGAFLLVNYGNPQWHWRLYAFQAESAPDGRLKPGSGFTGEWRNWSPDGKLVSVYSYRNGREHGPYKTFNAEGGVVSEGQFVDGGPDGIQRVNLEGGMRSEVPYEKGKRHGVEKNFYSDGQVAVEAPWNNGVQEGVASFYYENGAIQASVPFYAGKIEGVQKTWHENGAPASEEMFRGGLLHGPSKFWLPDGTAYIMSNYANDKMDGLQTWYYPNGNRSREIEFSLGEPNGRWREWDEAGIPTRDESYEMGELKADNLAQGTPADGGEKDAAEEAKNTER